jgi:hypothetical protein
MAAPRSDRRWFSWWCIAGEVRVWDALARVAGLGASLTSCGARPAQTQGSSADQNLQPGLFTNSGYSASSNPAAKVQQYSANPHFSSQVCNDVPISACDCHQTLVMTLERFLSLKT